MKIAVLSTPLLFLSLLAPLAQAADEAAAAPACRYAKLAALPVHYGAGGRPSILGSINGTPAPMLIDTGAARTMLTRTALAKRELPLSATRTAAQGVGGVTSLLKTRLTEFSVGPIKGGAISLPVIDEMGAAVPHEAIVGTDFLMQADLEFDLSDNELRFFSGQGCGSAPLAYWDKEALVIPMLARDQRWNDTSVRVNVKVNGVDLVAMLDSGASGSSLTEEAAKKIGIDVDKAERKGYSVGIGPEKSKRWVARVASFSIGAETVANIDMNIREVRGRGYGPADMLLGADFFRAHRILFANSQKKVYLSYLGGDVFNTRAPAMASQ